MSDAGSRMFLLNWVCGQVRKRGGSEEAVRDAERKFGVLDPLMRVLLDEGKMPCGMTFNPDCLSAAFTKTLSREADEIMVSVLDLADVGTALRKNETPIRTVLYLLHGDFLRLINRFTESEIEELKGITRLVLFDSINILLTGQLLPLVINNPELARQLASFYVSLFITVMAAIALGDDETFGRVAPMARLAAKVVPLGAFFADDPYCWTVLRIRDAS